MTFNPNEVYRFSHEDAEGSVSQVVAASDYDQLLTLFREVVCFRCKRSEEIDAMGMCIKHKLMAYPTEDNRNRNNSDLT